MARLSTVGKWLSHPLVLLLVGALVTTLVVPFVTRRWQETREELDLKAALASEITEKATGFAMGVQGVHLEEESTGEQPDLGPLNDAYRQWEVDSAVIASRLTAYFPDADLTADWRAYTRLVTEFYALEATPPPAQGAQIRVILDRLAASGEGGAEVEAEKDALRRLGLTVDGRSWYDLRAEVFGRKDVFVRRVLEADVDAL